MLASSLIPSEVLAFSGFLLLCVGGSIMFQPARSLLLVFIALELLLFGIAMLFMGFSLALQTPAAYVYLFVFLTLGGAESALALTILVLFFRQTNALLVRKVHRLKG